MAKLTNKQIEELERVLYSIKAARAYVFDADTAVCRRFGGGLVEVERAYGSPLCQVDTGIADLQRFLAEALMDKANLA